MAIKTSGRYLDRLVAIEPIAQAVSLICRPTTRSLQGSNVPPAYSGILTCQLGTTTLVEEDRLDVNQLAQLIKNQLIKPTTDVLTINAPYPTPVPEPEPEYYFSSWPTYIDSYSTSPEGELAWEVVKTNAAELKEIGLTHYGVYNYFTDGRNRFAERVAELRALGLKFIILGAGGYQVPDGSPLTIAGGLPRPDGTTHKVYRYEYDGGGIGTFVIGETVTSGVKSATILHVTDNGSTGTIILDSDEFVDDDAITSSGGKTANIDNDIASYYRFDNGTGWFDLGEIITSGAKKGKILYKWDNGAYGIIVVSSRAFVDGDIVTSPRGKVATINGDTLSADLDLRFFDTPGYAFQATVTGDSTSEQINGVRLDPSYDGWVWQGYLTSIGTALDNYGFTNDDWVVFDFECWFQPQGWAGTPNQWYNFGLTIPMVANSIRCGASPTPNPTNDQTIAFANYVHHWRQRGAELTQAVHNHSPLAKVIHYSEITEELFAQYVAYTPPLPASNVYMPPEVGDMPAPSFYCLDNFATVQAIVEKTDWSGSIAYISFSWNNGYIRLTDMGLIKIIGKYLKDNGFIGATTWPGPMSWTGQEHLFDSLEEYIEYYKTCYINFIAGFNS